MKWYKFNKANGYRQKRPPQKRFVLVCLRPKEDDVLEIEPSYRIGLRCSYPPSVCVGYLKYAAGDKSCPYFVVPGVGGEVTHWCDCLGDDFKVPVWG